MPFDSTPEQTFESRIIDETLRILGPDGKHWIKGSGVDDRHCLLHALNVAKHNVGASGDETHLRIIEAIRTVQNSYINIPDFNDEPERVFADVLEILRIARTVRVSALTRKVGLHMDPAQLVNLFQNAERKARRRKAIVTEAGMTAIAIMVMVAGVCIPI